MNPRSRKTGEILDQSLGLYSDVSPEELESSREQTLRYLETETGKTFPQQVLAADRVPPIWRWRWPVAGAAVIAAVLTIAVLTPVTRRQSPPARLEDGSGSRKIAYGEVVRPSAGGMLVLSDQSRVEMRGESELTLERATDGVQIRLNRGDVIVTAAKQRTGHLYVKTKDVIVSVVGTVFLVKTGEEGSRIAVIQGEVHVQQNGEEKKLHPGEQVSSNPMMKLEPVSAEIAWSREVEEHLAMLQQLTAPPPVPPEKRIVFEETSVKPYNPSSSTGRGAGGGGMSIMPSGCGGNYPIQIDPGRFVVSGATLHSVITWAYGTGPINYNSCQNMSAQNVVSGGPGWIRTDLWEIQATIPQGSLSYTPEQLRKGDVPQLRMMLRALLEDRFSIVMQNEVKEVPAYALTAETGAPKLTIPAGVGSMFANDPPGILREIGLFHVKNAPMSDFIPDLERQTARPVLDRTGLTGPLTFWVNYTPQNYSLSIPLTGPSIAVALQEQVGLKLENIKTKVEVWVIKSVEKPTPN